MNCGAHRNLTAPWNSRQVKGRTATSSKAVVVIGIVSGIRHLVVMDLQRVLRAIGTIVNFELGSEIRHVLTEWLFDYSCGCVDLFKKFCGSFS
jgi:hypothetical protein